MSRTAVVGNEYVTVMIGPQMFGIAIDLVNDIFKPERLTPVPLSHPDIAGVLNLRGRIVTMIDCRRRLGIAGNHEVRDYMAVGVERDGDHYGLLFDGAGEVLRFTQDLIEPPPVNLDPHWKRVSKGVFRMESSLLVVLDISILLDFGRKAAA
ncbi:MAG: chemotaxis protein CheW [Phycisphaerae bacterium]|jgi:purine-binding chemotaxis protein CheW